MNKISKNDFNVSKFNVKLLIIFTLFELDIAKNSLSTF